MVKPPTPFTETPTRPTTDIEREFRAFARAAAKLSHAEPWQVKRSAYIFCARYGLESCGTTLQAIATRLNLTRERVSQIFDRVQFFATQAPPNMPATRQLVMDIYDYLPAPVAVADDRFRPRLGPHASTRDMLRFGADFLGLEAPEVKARPVPLTTSSAAVAKIVNRPDWAAEALRLGAEQSRGYGAAQLEFVAGTIALRLGIACKVDELIRVLKSHPSFVWLDEATGWFCFTAVRKSRFETILRKILAVANDRLPIDKFLSALAAEWRWDDSYRGLAPLNLHYQIVLERLKHLDWVNVVQHNFIVPTKRIERGTALSGAEKVILSVLEKGRGVGTTPQIAAALRDAGYSDSSAKMALSRSPIVKPFARAVYTIRGRTPSIDALDRAVT